MLVWVFWRPLRHARSETQVHCQSLVHVRVRLPYCQVCANVSSPTLGSMYGMQRYSQANIEVELEPHRLLRFGNVRMAS
eukprot:1265698-Amphidinium_carterae.1